MFSGQRFWTRFQFRQTFPEACAGTYFPGNVSGERFPGHASKNRLLEHVFRSRFPEHVFGQGFRETFSGNVFRNTFSAKRFRTHFANNFSQRSALWGDWPGILAWGIPGILGGRGAGLGDPRLRSLAQGSCSATCACAYVSKAVEDRARMYQQCLLPLQIPSCKATLDGIIIKGGG